MDIAELDATLGDAHRAFVDTSTCIAYQSTSEAAHPLARHLFGRIADPVDPLAAYISIVSAAEMLVRPIQAGDHRLTLVSDFLQSFPNLHMLDATFDVALQAANVRALTRLALPDALLIGTAVLAGCEAIVTNDERWSRRLGPLFPRFTWIYLGR
jgi:predicted nucleic acid-binding protein